MRVCYFWPACDFRGKQWGALLPMDAFWIEATAEEAEAAIFPRLQPEQVAESRGLAERFLELASTLGSPARPFCFLVARDLSSIDPFCVHYPFHQMWNAYSPFRAMPEREVVHLEDLTCINLPSWEE